MEQKTIRLRKPPELSGWTSPKGMAESCRKESTLYRFSLELLDECGNRCPYCYRGSQDGKTTARIVRLERAKEIISQAADCGAKVITLNGGEVMLYPQVEEIVSHVNEKGMQPLIFTSGTEMNDGMAAFLYEKGASLIVKRNSYDDNGIQDRMFGLPAGSDSLLKIEKTLALLIDAGFNKSEPTRLAIETVMSSINLPQIPSLFRFARQNNIYPFFELITPKAYTDKKLLLGINEARKAFERLLKIDREEFGFNWVPHPPMVAATCNYFDVALYAKTDLRVQLCPGTPIVVGDLARESLAQIVKKKATRRLRDIRGRLMGKCSLCSHHIDLGCYGCRAHAFEKTGDHFAPYPACWQNKM